MKGTDRTQSTGRHVMGIVAARMVPRVGLRLILVVLAGGGVLSCSHDGGLQDPEHVAALDGTQLQSELQRLATMGHRGEVEGVQEGTMAFQVATEFEFATARDFAGSFRLAVTVSLANGETVVAGPSGKWIVEDGNWKTEERWLARMTTERKAGSLDSEWPDYATFFSVQSGSPVFVLLSAFEDGVVRDASVAGGVVLTPREGSRGQWPAGSMVPWAEARIRANRSGLGLELQIEIWYCENTEATRGSYRCRVEPA